MLFTSIGTSTRDQVAKVSGAISIAIVHTARLQDLIPRSVKQVDWLFLDANHGSEDGVLLGLDFEQVSITEIFFGHVPPSVYATKLLNTFGYYPAGRYAISQNYVVYHFSRLELFGKVLSFQQYQWQFSTISIYEQLAAGVVFTGIIDEDLQLLRDYMGFRIRWGIHPLMQPSPNVGHSMRIFLNGATHCSSRAYHKCDPMPLPAGFEELFLYIHPSLTCQRDQNTLRILIHSGQDSYEGILNFSYTKRVRQRLHFCPNNEIVCAPPVQMYATRYFDMCRSCYSQKDGLP